MKRIIYEKIYLGASLLVLIKLFFEKKNVLVIEKENCFGGAWKIGSGKYKNLDLACHLLVPSSKNEGIKISNFFRKFKLNVREVFKKEFYADINRWKSYGKNGPAMICDEGWPKILNVFEGLVAKKQNIKIIKNLKVNKLVLQDQIVKVLTKDKMFLAKQVLFPSYSSLKYFYVRNKKEFLPRKKITNYHYLITLKCRSNLLVKNFQCFYSKKSKYLFDRLSVSFLKKRGDLIHTIVTARLGKIYKKKIKKINKKEISNFMTQMGLVHEISELKFKVIEYDCYYRDINDRKITIKNLKKSRGKIFWLNTMYFGYFISYLLKNNKNYINK